MATKKKSGKKSSKRRPKPFIVPGDPPIIVGGGGSTWVWIKKDSNPQLVSPPDYGGFDPPDNDTKPAHPEDFYIFHLADVSIKKITARNGIGSENNQDVPQNNPNAKKKHHTFFQQA